MPDRKTVMSWLEGLTQDDWQLFHSDSEVQQIAMAALELLNKQDTEYEKGFNDAMQGKRELMYEGIDGKWYKKDW